MKYKCIRLECPICNKQGLAQLFLNKEGNIKYARVRHYSHKDSTTGKPQFTYCKIENLDALKTLLKCQDISLTTEKPKSGQVGHDQTQRIHDQENCNKGSIQQDLGGCRLVWFRILAFQANDPGFKSRRPHHTSTYRQTVLGKTWVFPFCIVHIRLQTFLTLPPLPAAPNDNTR